MSRPVLTIDELNALDQDAFVQAIGFVFEHTPAIARATWQQRPFAHRDDLFAALTATLDRLDDEAKLALIRAHPDLVGRGALAGTLGPESTGEQASAGLNVLSHDEIVIFSAHNASYWERFGFPFVICVRENKKAGILAGFEQRLHHSREQEIATALGEIKKIAWLRLCDIVQGQ